jgi:hypothetical protein
VSSTTAVMPRPAHTPRAEKRAGSVIRGSSSSAIAGLRAPPLSAMPIPSSSCELSTVPKTRYSGRWLVAIRGRSTAYNATCTSSGIAVHHPIHGTTLAKATPTAAYMIARGRAMRASMSRSRARSCSVGQSHVPFGAIADVIGAADGLLSVLDIRSTPDAAADHGHPQRHARLVR